MVVSKACATTAVLVSPERQTPVTRMVSALMLEVTKETMKTSITALSPCWRGSPRRGGAPAPAAGPGARRVGGDAARAPVPHRAHDPDARAAADEGARGEGLTEDEGED